MKGKGLVWLVVLLCISVGVSALMTDNLLAYYPFDSHYNNIINTSTYTLVNDPTYPNFNATNYRVGNASITFNGSDKLANYTSKILDYAGNATISFWMYRHSNKSLDPPICYDCNGAGCGILNYSFRSYFTAPNYLNLTFEFRNVSNGEAVVYSNSLALNTWHFIMVVYLEGNVSLYVNGSYVSSARLGGGLRGSAQQLNIGGAAYAGTSYKFNGSIDEVGFWNRGLSISEISVLYNDGVGFGYPFTLSGLLNVTAVDLVNGSVVQNFSVAVANVSNVYCYQETADVGTSCGGYSTGAYSSDTTNWTDFANLYDGSWSTYGNAVSAPDVHTYFYVNYTRANLSNQNLSRWQLKDEYGTFNISVPVSCWGSKLQFRIDATRGGFGATDNAACYNSTAWQVIYVASGEISNNIYEEGMWWSVVDTSVMNFSVNNTYTAVNGVVNLSGLSEYYWFDIQSAGYDAYVTLWNVLDGNLNVNLTPSYFGEVDVVFNATQRVTDSFIYVNVSMVDNSLLRQNHSYSNLFGGTSVIVNSSVYNVTVTSQGYLNNCTNNSVSVLSDVTFNCQLYSGVLNVSAVNSSGSISDFSVWLNYSNGYSEMLTTASGLVQFNITKGLIYGLRLDATGLGYAYVYANVSVVNASQAYQFTVGSPVNSINVSVFDEATGALIPVVNVSVEGASYVYLYETAGGSVLISNLYPDTYIVKVGSDVYSYRTYSVTVLNGSSQSLNVYLASSTNTVLFTSVDDTSSLPLEGVSISMSTIINSSWVIIESKSSDVTGRAQFAYVPINHYRFLFSRSGYDSRLFDLNPILISEYTIRLVPSLSVGNLSNDYGSVYVGYSVSPSPYALWDGEVNTVTLAFSSGLGTLESFGASLKAPNCNVYNSSTNAVGGSIVLNCTLSGSVYGDVGNLTYWYDDVYGSNKSYSAVIPITGFGSANQTIAANFKKDYGFGQLEKIVIVNGLVMLGAGATMMVAGSVAALVVGLFIYGFFIQLGFITFWMAAITFFIGFLFIVTRSQGGS